jgi:cystathionine beta-lyase/cystathionine gamma-synthase
MHFSTKAIHAGQHPDPSTNAVVTPIFQTSTYAHDELGKHKGYSYGRTANPTREALEKNIAALEDGKYGVAFSSGIAAISAIANLMKNGDHILISENTYGGTFRLFDQIISHYGIKYNFVDPRNLDELEKLILPETKMLFTETPTNPMMILTDLEKAAFICKKHNILCITDNTFMTPYFQNPLKLGCDIVIHSTTKYLNGHSDVIGGIVITNNEEVYNKLKFIQNAMGAVPSPFDCWLVLRSTKTLSVRMRQHNENGIKIAKFLEKYPKVIQVFYPGLESHPQYDLALRQMTGFGGMISVELGSFENARKLLNSVKIFTLAESLGGVESLICHPVSMTHKSVPKAERERFGLTEGLVRLSVGIEDAEDLIEDLENALKLI